MDEAGLAVADSRAWSADEGPGLPVYCLAEALLERCAGVPEALEMLHSLPRLGGNNVVLADAAGGCRPGWRGHAARRGDEAAQGFDPCKSQGSGDASAQNSL